MLCLEIISWLKLYIPYIREFKHMWHQIYKVDYCLKHFKLVSYWFQYVCEVKLILMMKVNKVWNLILKCWATTYLTHTEDTFDGLNWLQRMHLCMPVQIVFLFKTHWAMQAFICSLAMRMVSRVLLQREKSTVWKLEAVNGMKIWECRD